MTASDRHEKIKEVEEIVATLQDKGWRVEEVQHTDQPDTPFESKFTLTFGSTNEREGIL